MLRHLSTFNFKGYLKLIGFFAAFILVIGSLDYLFVPNVIQKAIELPSDYFEFEKSDIVFLGDSHSAFGLNSKQCRSIGLKCQNLSYGGHYWEFNYYLLQRLKILGLLPKTVVVGIPYFSFKNESDLLEIRMLFSQHHSNEDRGNPHARLVAEFVSQHFQLDISAYLTKFSEGNLNSYRARDLLGRGVVLSLFKAFLGTAHKVRYVGDAENGNPRFLTQNLSNTPGAKIADFKPINLSKACYLPLADCNRQSALYFRKLVEFIAQENINAWLVEIPEHIGTQNSYLGINDFYIQIEKIINEVAVKKRLTVVRQGQFKSIDSSNPLLFFDGGLGNENSHLSFEGSKMFTDELLKMIGRSYL